MCIAIYQPAGTEIPKEYLQESWKNNRDGAGLLWQENNTLYSFKELKSFEIFYDKYFSILESTNNESPVLIHFRIRTHGPVDESNCHPHFVNKNLAFIHNGIIDISIPKKSTDSDTVAFNKQILQRMPENFLDYPGCVTLVADRMDNYNKLVFMDNYGNVTLINEHLGVWDEECSAWFSNLSYLPRAKPAKVLNSWRWEKDQFIPSHFEGEYLSSYEGPQECAWCGITIEEPEELEHSLCFECQDELDSDSWREFSEERILPLNEAYPMDKIFNDDDIRE